MTLEEIDELRPEISEEDVAKVEDKIRDTNRFLDNK